MRFRKKPVVIEAETVLTLLRLAKADWKSLPEWFRAVYERGDALLLDASIQIHTLEGRMHAGLDDWLIQGVKGEVYPCKPDIFAATYEPVEGQQQ